ncbi:MAG: DUF4230 domain-containing protein [bacterium]
MFGIRRALLLVGFVLLSAAALALVLRFSLGWGAPEPEPQVTVTARSILERVSDRYFVVTKSVYVDQKSEITVDTGSRWSNFFWGQTVQANGVIRVDVGVDMTRLAEDDITVDSRSKTVRIDIPPADILDASQYGDIEVESKQGVLKYVLDNDPNEDHNRALERLVADAKESVRQDPQLFADARRDAARLLGLIVEGTGYRLEFNVD